MLFRTYRLAAVVLGLASLAVNARAESPAAGAGADAPLRLLAMGDWGANNAAQRQTAHAMTIYAAAHPVNGMLLAGDNFLMKLSGPEDPIIRTVFEEMYPKTSLNVPFYAAPGNHDYEPGKLAVELAYSKTGKTRFTLPSNYYRVDLPKDAPLVTVLMLDSNKEKLTPAQWNEELEWMQRQLADAQGKRWIVCCAHHPFYSNGTHGDNGVLRKDWLPLFEKYGVDLYVCGHDHDVQHLELPKEKVSLLLVGGGGATTRLIRQDNRGPFARSAHGFGVLEFTPEVLTAHLMDAEGEELHAFTRTRAGKVEVEHTVASDRAVPRTVKSITRGE